MRVEWENISKSARQAADALNGPEWVRATFGARALLYDLADERDRLAAEAGRLREQRDAYLAYAAHLLCQQEPGHDGWYETPERAVAAVVANAQSDGTTGYLADRKLLFRNLAECRDAVRALRDQEASDADRP